MRSASAASHQVRALHAGPGALPTLRRPGNGAVEIAFGGGAYIRLEDDWLLLCGPRSPRGPLSVVVTRAAEKALRPAQHAQCDGRMLAVGGLSVDLGRVRSQREPPPPPRKGATASALAAALAACPRPPPDLVAGVAALASTPPSVSGASGEATNGGCVGLLAGLGDGLTPAGDDVLAGYAGWLHAEGSPVSLSPLAARRSSPIGLAYLRCAERGALPAPAARLLAAARRGDAAAARRAARNLSRWGTTSGPALLWGMAAAERALRPTVGRA